MKKISSFFILLVSFSCFSNAQIVTIGSQVWMSKNLDVNTFRNGDPIPQAKTGEEWVKAGNNKQPAWCYYDNDSANGMKYGKLYNWYALNDPRGLAPEGYHVPSDKEWTTLTDYLGGEVEAGSKMKSESGWNKLDLGENGTNESGFSGLPGGICRGNNGTYIFVGKYGYWWSSTEYDTDYAWYRLLSYSNGNISGDYSYKINGMLVRCLRD